MSRISRRKQDEDEEESDFRKLTWFIHTIHEDFR